MMTNLEKAILATIVYADVLNRPLTGWEVFRYQGLSLEAPPRTVLDLILKTLENSQELGKFITQKNGFYFLKGRGKIVRERIARQKLADRKWKKTRKIIWWLQGIPYIRMVLVSGSLAMNNPGQESDIDLLIVTQAGRIWTCRALTTLFIHCIGQRRHQHLTKDRICLNHYITDQSLDIKHKSLYNAVSYAHLVPLLELDGLFYQNFQQANQWIQGRVLAAIPPRHALGLNLRKIRYSFFLNMTRKFKEKILNSWLGDWAEQALKNIQVRHIKKDPLTYKKGGRVIFNDRELEFHPDSPEKWILEKYNQKMQALDFPELGQEKDSGLL